MELQALPVVQQQEGLRLLQEVHHQQTLAGVLLDQQQRAGQGAEEAGVLLLEQR
jgi:hypothetical protein